MDVIVDTCILFPDPFMRSNRFKDLFQYLRTTDSRLVIPPIVFDEVVAKHETQLVERYEKACSASELLNAATLHPLAPPVGKLNLSQEATQFSEFLKSGRRIAEPLPLKVLLDYSIIDVKEVAARGIKRKPPANANGEELRDVMVWLAALSYCRQSKNPVGFISDDKGFWTKDKKAIRPELVEELAREHLELQVYLNITEFLKSTAIKSTNLSNTWFAQRVSISIITEMLNKYRETLVYGVWHGSRSVELLKSNIEFKSGVLYELGEGAHLAEVEFSCRIALRVSDWPYPPPEANLPPEQAAQARLLQTPIWSWRYEVNGSLFVSLRLQDDKITDIALERFEYEHPSAETLLVPSPVFLRQGYS